MTSDEPATEARCIVVICVTTRRRPQMLKCLLLSLATMHHAQAVERVFLVVENDDAANSQALVDEMRPAFGEAELHYHLEDRLGIPIARNRAISFSVAIGADLLAFVDDDEIVDKAWLDELIIAHRSSGALLLGGPVLAAPLSEETDGGKRLVHSAIAKRYERKAGNARKLAANGRDVKVTITTGNWLGSTALFIEHGLRFDETMRFSGGSDAAFFKQVKQLKLPVKWVPDAIVHETVPSSRLTFRYQFQRAFNQSNTSFRRKLDKNKLHALSIILTVPLRTIAVVVLVLAIIPTAGATCLSTLRGAGWIAGRLAAVLGRKSDLYVQTTGH